MSEFDPSAPAINEEELSYFGCGSANAIGLKLRFRERPEGGVWTTFTPTRAHEGQLGMTHGGILATMLDEAMSWSVTQAGELGITAQMTLTFRKPARQGEELLVSGWIETAQGRAIDTRGEIRQLGDDVVVAEAEGHFTRISRHRSADWRAGYAADASDTVAGRAALRSPKRESGSSD